MPIRFSHSVLDAAVNILAREKGITQSAAIEILNAEYRAKNLFLRDGFTPDASRSGGAVKEINGKSYYVTRQKCIRCGGQGGWKGWPGFTCFRCGGTGYEHNLTKEPLYTADEIDRLDAIAVKREATRAKKAAARDAQAAEERARLVETLKAGNPLYVRLTTLERKSEFVTSIIDQMEKGKDLSSAQHVAAARLINRIDEEARLNAKAQAGAAHVGAIGERISFVGMIAGKFDLGVSDYTGRTRWLVKILTDKGETLIWFTEAGAPEKGAKVAGKATVKDHSEHDGLPQTIIQRAKIGA